MHFGPETSLDLKKLFQISLILALTCIWAVSAAQAQQDQPDGPVYVVQAGDTLGYIARQFGISTEELADANNITNPNLLSEGTQLVIPGLEGVQGFLTTVSVPFGENLESLSRRYQVDAALLARLNHITSPSELYAGASLVIPQQAEAPTTFRRVGLATGQSLLELAVLNGANPWSAIHANGMQASWEALPGESLFLPGGADEGPGALPGEIQAIELIPLPFGQGRTGEVKVAAAPGLMLEGSFMDRQLNFFPDPEGGYIALLGIHALAEPGYYPFSIKGSLPDGTSFAFSQKVGVRPEDYPFDQPLTVDPATIDPAITRPEDAEWNALTTTATPERLWDGLFRIPSPFPQDYCLETNECWTSRFGNRRSYNGSEYEFFHTGLDIAGGTGTEIFAPAKGKVVFAGPLTVRGNATMIDHGWGVYTGYMHQSEIYVEVGDEVEPGDVIGLVGGTGRVEGPHLHWEVWVGGVQVDPLDWLAQTFP
jgi:murein DD-endopeptidase MepM/ murein hydrolase activator NlpD